MLTSAYQECIHRNMDILRNYVNQKSRSSLLHVIAQNSMILEIIN